MTISTQLITVFFHLAKSQDIYNFSMRNLISTLDEIVYQIPD